MYKEEAARRNRAGRLEHKADCEDDERLANLLVRTVVAIGQIRPAHILRVVA